jgi:ABC-type molybdate transport system ATPase subunit
LFSSPSSYLGIHLCWERLRAQLAGQERVTIVLHRALLVNPRGLSH